MGRISENIFHVQIAEDTYLISSLKSGPKKNMKSMLPGKATANSYLIVGKEKAILFDMAVDEGGVYEYAKNLAGKEVLLILSHGHYDHTYHLNTVTDVWMHIEDEFLLKEGMPLIGVPPVYPCPRIHYIQNEENISLGERELKVIHIPGHTPGSVLLLDEKSKLLFSGDTGARRLLLGVSGAVNEKILCDDLEKLKQENFLYMYSAHDRCAIPKEHIDLMLGVIRGEIEFEEVVQQVPLVGTFYTRNYGVENDLKYFNIAFVKKDNKAGEP